MAVFSRTLDRPSSSNTTVVKGDPATEARRMKGERGPDMVVLGSGTIVSRNVVLWYEPRA